MNNFRFISDEASKNKTGLVLLANFLISWVAFLPKTAPHVTAGDAAELALAGETLGVAHPPGYPVFVVVQHTLGNLFFWGNDAYAQNLASGILCALTLVVLSYTLIQITKNEWFGLIPILLLWSPQFEHQAGVTEVFPLTVLWAALLFLALFVFYRRRQGIFLVAFLTGAGFAVHQTLLLLIPGFIAFYIRNKKQPFSNLIKDFAPISLFFCLGASVILFIPIRSMADPVLDWENPESLSRFWGVLKRERYGFFQLAQGNPVRHIGFEPVLHALIHVQRVFINNFGWAGVIFLAIASVVSLAKRFHRRIIVVCWLSVLFTGPFFFWMAAIPLDAKTDILNRFGLLPLVPAVIIIGVGVSLIWNSETRLYRAFLGIALAVFLLEMTIRRPPELSAAPFQSFTQPRSEKRATLRWDLSMRESGLNILRMIPPNAILFADRADETEFTLAYLLFAENRRPQTWFVDANAGVTESIYGDDYYTIWGRPRLEIRTRVENEILEETDRPVFYATREPNMIDVYRYRWGFIYGAKGINKLRLMKEIQPYEWLRFLTWHFTPVEPRAKGIKQINLQFLAEARFDYQKYQDAERIFGLVQRLSGSHRWEQMGYWYQKRRMNSQARGVYQKAVDAGIYTKVILANLGHLMERRFEFGNAVELYKQGLTLGTDDAFFKARLGHAYFRIPDYPRAIEAFEDVLKADPTDVLAKDRLERARERRNIGEPTPG